MIEKVKEIIEKRILELYKADAEYCKDRWDSAKKPLEKSIAREMSNQVTFARQELQDLLKKIEAEQPLPRPLKCQYGQKSRKKAIK